MEKLLDQICIATESMFPEVLQQLWIHCCHLFFMAALEEDNPGVLDASHTTCSPSTSSSPINLLIGRQVVSVTAKLAVPRYFCSRVCVPNAREPNI